MTLVIAGGAALAIILIALGISMSGTGGVTLERLERYASTAKSTEPGAAGQGGVAELIAKSAALAQLNKVVEKRDFGANLLLGVNVVPNSVDLGVFTLDGKAGTTTMGSQAPLENLVIVTMSRTVKVATAPTELTSAFRRHRGSRSR